MKWALEYSDKAKKFLKTRSKDERERIEKTIDKIADAHS